MKHNTAWNIPDPPVIPEALLRAGYTPLLAAVLALRGITTPQAAEDFLGDDRPMQDPLDLRDMDKAVSRVRLACQNREHIAVFGDYDVDGITAASLLTDYLRSLGLETELYIPNRLTEGYGMNAAALEALHQKGVSLVITVDCGITAATETEVAASLGMDVIITDHHECPEALPAAVAVVDPKRPDCGGSPELAGVGVAFKLVCALCGSADQALGRYADLAAVGTVADVMPLVGENRRIVKAGLEKLRRDPRPGLAALMEEAASAPQRLSATTIGFTLAPRINAAGRLGTVSCAAELMLESDPARAKELAEELCSMNRTRQSLEADIWAQAEEMLSGQSPDRPIVLAREGWHQGVIGIVASRMADAHCVPAVMISLDGDAGKGSCRSFGDFNLFDALTACREHLSGFGGHALAAGLNIARESVDAFREALGDFYAEHPPGASAGLSPDIFVDSGDLLSIECVQSLDALEPCGSGNPRPIFCLTDAKLVSVTAIGGGKHTALRLEKFGHVYECVWFSQKADELGVSPGDRVDAVFSPQISDFRGRRSVQLHMQALRRTDIAAVCRSILCGGDAPGLSLDRGELALIWRALVKQCPAAFAPESLRDLAPDLDPEKIALGLRVFSEVGLAKISQNENAITASILSREGKADLMQSAAWRKYHR